jgi:hypothetical protein
VTRFKPGEEVYGVTNPQFIGAYAEIALASAKMIARKLESLSFSEAALVPVVAVTAWQMLFDYAKATPGQTVLFMEPVAMSELMQSNSQAKPVYTFSRPLRPMTRNMWRALAQQLSSTIKVLD